MAATLIAEKPQSLKYEGGVLTATRVLQFKTARGDAPSVFVGHADLPFEGQAHPDFAGTFCTAVALAQQANGVEWTATISYSSELKKDEDPLLDPVVITWSGENYSEAVFQDSAGNAILNTAGDYFVDPSPVKEKSHLIAKITSNEANVPLWVMTLRDKTNNTEITIDDLTVDIGKALVKRIEIGKEKLRNGTNYREVSFEIHLHPDGWNLKPLNAGFRERDATTNELKQILNSSDNTEITMPVPLDASGYAITDPTPSTAIFGSFTVYEAADITVLPGIS